jgi:uncharacterized protein
LKFQPDTLAGINNITHVDAASLRVNGTPYSESVLIPWVGTVQTWAIDGAPAPSSIETLTRAHFEALLAFEPEVVIFGSGPRLRFVSPALYRGLIERRIGLETMDSSAACRTYTVLANEGRRVVAAILLGSAAAAGNP